MAASSQKSFAGGEIAPALYARCDTVKYQSGLKSCRNMIVMRTGGAQNRMGTTFVGEVKDSTKPVRLIPFLFSDTQTYLLEFGDLYMRPVKNGLQLTDTFSAISAITNATPGVVTTSAAHGLTSGDIVAIAVAASSPSMTALVGRSFKVTVLSSTTFSLQHLDGVNVNTTALGAYAGGLSCARLYKCTTSIPQAALADMQTAQSADVVTVVHNSLQFSYDIARTGDTNWTAGFTSFAIPVSPPSPIVTAPAAGSVVYEFAVTSISADTGEESLMSAAVSQSGSVDAKTSPWLISWTTIGPSVSGYNVYRNVNGVFAFIGAAGGQSTGTVGFTYNTNDVNVAATPPRGQRFLGYAAAVGYYQQRRIFGGFGGFPSTARTSRSGAVNNQLISTPTQDDDPVTFTLAGKVVHQIRHFLDLGALIIFTNAGEWVVEGNAAGVLTPSSVNPRVYSSNGSSRRPPLAVGNSAVYVQTNGSSVFDLGYDYQVKGFDGDEVSIFAAHLLDGFTIVDWAYQKRPHSIVWAVRSDGVLLGMTYVKKQEIIAWHRHDTDGTVENVCVIPENGEDVVYLVVKRTINGRQKRYIERMNSRNFTDIRDANFLDCSLSFDGRNTLPTIQLTLTGGTSWTTDETLTLTASDTLSGPIESPIFTASDVGSQIQLTSSTGTVVRFNVTGYSSALVVTGTPERTVPAALQNVGTLVWARAVKTLRGLFHLEGKAVSVIGDGFVLASPNNPKYDVITVSSGTITLPIACAVVRVGLPITSDLETLDLDNPQGEPLSDKAKKISAVTVHLEKTRGLFIGGQTPGGNTITGLTSPKPRSTEFYDNPNSLLTGRIELNIESHWSSNGRVLMRQVDPLPVTILAVEPTGIIPGR